ncbi:uncharacterized protein LOC105829369 isoform X2 [Monomorium pharaonis]|uniref:uncharacterized protein LOC105829369 isoform X2 n=1 Tax=Monomorium pharaonis TaxID=307658 RepID=UPI00063F74A9|nr:uncharacterized protein LOC105829369 isoform X2 [Monomorium pharaonis]
MGKVTQRKSTDREETPKPRRKRRKADLNRIHSRILQAKRKLDNNGKDDKKSGQKKQGRAKICDRLLPEPAAGIYRNGIKGKNIHRAQTTTNTYRKARLKGDALKLFSGETDTPRSIVEIPVHDETTEQSPNNNCMKDSLKWTPCILEQSPILGQNKNHKPHLVKKKIEENIFKDADSNDIKKQNVNNKSRKVQKENICKRKLFQNDCEQLETVTTTPTQIFDNTDLVKENEANKKGTKQMCSKNSKNLSYDPLSHYMEFCRVISAENFEEDILPNFQSDPVATITKRLKNIYADSYRQHLLRKKKQELENVKYSVEYQACTNSDVSQLSPIEFEVPKCSENHITAHLQAHNANGSLENYENSDTPYLKQSKDKLSKSKYFCLNKKDSIQLDSQENTNYVNHLLKSKHDTDNFSIDIPRNSHYIDNSKNLRTSMYLSDPVLSERYLKDYSCEKLSTAVSDSSTLPQKCNNRTNNWNIKKRVPSILRRCNITINNPSHSVQINNDYTEDLYEKCETNLFNRSPSNGIKKELYKTAFPTNVFTNLPTSKTINATFDQTKILEPQIGTMKIKDSQESQVEQFDINMHPKEHNERNEFCQYNNFLHPQIFEASYDTNQKLPRQKQNSLETKKHIFHSNNYRLSNYLQRVNFSNSNIESAKQCLRQTKLHAIETNKQEAYGKNTRQNQNILSSNDNDRMTPIPIFIETNFSQDTQTEKRSAELCQKNLSLFSKTDVKCAKNQINQNACHCNEQYIYFNSANCSRKYKEQAHFHKEMIQPESLRNTKGYNNSTDSCVNLSNATQNVPLLSLNQKNNLFMYPKAIDDQHRAVLLQDVTQPVKYLAVENDSEIQRIPVYINDDKSVRIVENVPLKVIALMDPSTQTKAFPQEIGTKVVPLQTDGLHLNSFVTHKISDQSFMKRLDPMKTVLLNPDSQSNIWYASNL